MKKLILILIMVASTGIHAQLDKNEKMVTVYGSAKMETEITNYRIKATLSMDQVYYADVRLENLDQLKKKYFSALTEDGIDVTKFTEKDIEYFAQGYQREGTILYFETPSVSMAKKVMSLSMTGVQLQLEMQHTLKQNSSDIALKAALLNAESSAKQMCAAIGTSLGEIASVSNSNFKDSEWISYYNGYEKEFTVNVIYYMN